MQACTTYVTCECAFGQVGEAMTANPVTVTPNISAKEAASLMLHKKVGCPEACCCVTLVLVCRPGGREGEGRAGRVYGGERLVPAASLFSHALYAAWHKLIA
jgi:CBS domain-containing protein